MVMSHEQKAEGFETEVILIDRISAEEMIGTKIAPDSTRHQKGEEIENLTVNVV
jgi:hypothetical protein